MLYFFFEGYIKKTICLFMWYFAPLSTVHIINVFPGFLPVLGLGSEVSCRRTLPQKKKKKKPHRIQCGLNPGPLDYESNT